MSWEPASPPLVGAQAVGVNTKRLLPLLPRESRPVGARQAKKDSPLENPMVDRTSQVLVLGSVVGTVALAAVSLS